MASINPETAWEFADAIKSVLKLPTTRRRATVQSVDKDGTIWVQLPGSSNVTPIASTGANVAPGDTVLTELRGTSLHITENNTDPAVGTRQAGDIARQAVKPAVDAAKAAQEIATEAQAVADATNQHFWDDDNGAHVTDVTKDEWTAAAADDFSDLSDAKPYHNLLMNSLGILLRRALNNLVSISRSAIAFYDGLGNAAANIVARFGADGAQIGLTDESHMELDYHSLKMVDKEGTTYFHVSDLREADGSVEITETFTGDGTLYLFTVAFEVSAEVSATDSSDASNTVTRRAQRYIFTHAPASGATVTIVYKSQSDLLKGFTFGSRKSGSRLGALSVAEGYLATASGNYSHAEGSNTTASGDYSHAEGSKTTASGDYSHAEGFQTTASGDYSHAEGFQTTASGDYSHAEGEKTTASGFDSHAEGFQTQTRRWAFNSHAQNYHTIAASDSQTAMGKYNIEDANNAYALIIGNGTADDARSNALAVTWDGTCDVGNVQSVSGDNHAYPLFIWTSSMTNPESYSGTYPVSPCFVYYVPNNGLYYCEN